MQASALQISDNFRRMAFRSVFSIVLFVFTYLLLIALGIGVILLCGLIAYFLVVSKAMFITLMLALGFIGMGFLIFFFLIKFIFSKSNKIDRSHLLEITEKQQPELFKLIHEIVTEVQTKFPKKVYLSSDVNASVFYDSSFWSMFFPVKKNLQIGLGLMNSISVIELKAILAHEFGHFSQRSMKVGSYVHHVNKVIYNMLYDNEGYSNLIGRWSDASSYFILFAKGAILVVQGIQYVLVKVHAVLNLNYMALSREMEFHADAVAANVAGSQPLVNSLLRLELADQSLNVVFNYYSSKIAESQKANNFYPQQYFVLNQLASAEELPIQDGLPTLSVESYKKFNKTKLVLDDQWSSHPSTEQRVAKLNALNLPSKGNHKGIAIDLLADKELLQNLITERLFEGITYETQPSLLAPEDFIADYKKQEAESSYPPVFKGYFDERHPYKNFTADDLDSPALDHTLRFEELINEQSATELNSLKTAIADQETISKINRGEIQIQSFDYDGTKYSAMDAFPLISYLATEIENLNKALDQRDADLFKFFLTQAVRQGELANFKKHILAYQQGTIHSQAQQEACVNLLEATAFMQTSTPLEQIRTQMVQVKKMEEPFKAQVRLVIENTGYQEVISTEMRTRFEEYLDKNWSYFGHDTYFNAEVDAFFAVVTDFTLVVFKHHFNLKKTLLQFQAGIISS
jgi:Zn-dependent protease with chaperone function